MAPLSKLAAATQADVVIKMLDMPPAFQPNLTTIKVGQRVEWENVGNEVHHATSDPSFYFSRNEPHFRPHPELRAYSTIR